MTFTPEQRAEIRQAYMVDSSGHAHIIMQLLAIIDAAEARVDEMSASFRRYSGSRNAAIARADAAEADRDRYREHSIWLNSLSWRIAEAVGDVPDGVDNIEGDPNEQLTRLITERDTAIARAERAEADSDQLVTLVGRTTENEWALRAHAEAVAKR